MAKDILVKKEVVDTGAKDVRRREVDTPRKNPGYTSEWSRGKEVKETQVKESW